MTMDLFDGDDCSPEEDISKIEIDEDFARRYEHNKKREDLMRLSELKKRGLAGKSDSDDDDVSSSDEDDEGELSLNPKEDVEFLDALIKVKNQDPMLKEKEAKLFNEEEEETETEQKGVKISKKKKPMYLKDVTAKHLIEEGPEFDDDDNNNQNDEKSRHRVKSYSEEQDEIRRHLIEETEKAADEVDDGEDMFKVKESAGNYDEYDEEDEGEVEKKLDEYFGKDGDLDENSVFLKQFFRNRMWVGEDKALDEERLVLSDDEEEIEKQEDYEREFNFRFEENAGDRVLGHSRFVEGSVRKKNNARKVQRKSKEERMAQADFERKEELKRLKNLKKKEISEKLKKINEVAGIEGDGVCLLDEDDLEDEFDPEEHDRKMRETFNAAYYGADDADPEFGSDCELEKPDFDKEDELLGLGKGWDEVMGPKDGFLAVRERNLKRKADEKESVDVEGKGKMPKVEEVLNKELEEYYKLDYEDTIGDLKTRFKYKEVDSRRYGLSTEEILKLDDKELNQYVPIKRIAPYREKEWKVDRNKVRSQKEKNKLLLRGEKVEDHKSGKKKLEIHQDSKPQPEETNGDTSKLSRKSRRKQRQADLKLSHSRLLAYGKIPSKSKSKKKH